MRIYLISLCMAGAALASCGVSRADTISVAASKDNTLYQDDDGLLSNGAGSYFFCGVNGNGELRRGLIAFDCSSIPIGSTVTSVTLRLSMSRTSAGPEFVRLHRMLQDWGQGSSNAAANEGMGAPAQPGDATWVHAFSPSMLWGEGMPVTGGHFDPVASATTLVDQIAFYNWTDQGLVADVQAFVNEQTRNFGWIVVGTEDGAATAKRFDSRENATATRRPMLTVGYTPPIMMCKCDVNMDGHLNSADFFDFLTAFFNETTGADFDGSGQINSADFFAFLMCFFSMPSGCM